MFRRPIIPRRRFIRPRRAFIIRRRRGCCCLAPVLGAGLLVPLILLALVRFV